MNNYPNTDLVDNIDCAYIVYGKEVGESGTPHLQGFIRFSNARTFKSVTKILPGCHIEVARCAVKAIEYCKKDGDFTERGDAPFTQEQKGKVEKERWDLILKAAQEGNEEAIPEEIRFKYDRNIERIRYREIRKRTLEDTEVQHEWYYGASRTGKSRKAREENPGFYFKLCNKWWDNYTDQETVIIEDFDKRHDVLIHHLKIWADRYPFSAEVKGGIISIRPTKIIITSNYHPTDIWTDERDLDPILNRFKCTEFKRLAMFNNNK